MLAGIMCLGFEYRPKSFPVLLEMSSQRFNLPKWYSPSFRIKPASSFFLCLKFYYTFYTGIRQSGIVLYVNEKNSTRKIEEVNSRITSIWTTQQHLSSFGLPIPTRPVSMDMFILPCLFAGKLKGLRDSSGNHLLLSETTKLCAICFVILYTL